MKFTPKIKENRWDVRIEKQIFAKWFREKIYDFDIKTKKKIFSIDTPPPYPSGAIWHIGAAAHYSQIDMIARTARMLGFETYFPIGIDRNGIPVERYTEQKHNIKMHETPREKFLELAKVALDDLETEMIGIMKSMGMSGDFDNYYRTDSDAYRALTQATFIKLWKRGMIYEDTRPNNYCADCKTTVADADIQYEERSTQLVYVKWRVKETNEEIVIATTRPELIVACQVVIVNPNDDRHKHLIGQHAILPIYRKEVPILAHPAASPEYGTGIVMICSYGDYDDVRVLRELKIKTETIAINLDGKMTGVAGKYAGLRVEHARKAITEDLEAQGFVVRKDGVFHRTPICDRSNTPIEIIPMKEFYLKQVGLKKKLLQLQKKIKFHPEMHRQLLVNWINSITIDWPISRRRYYGTEIPIWYCENCQTANVPETGKYYRPWKDKFPGKCLKCGKSSFRGETRTFDTWFDSSISPLFISKFGSCTNDGKGGDKNDSKKEDKIFFAKTYPNTLRPQGKEIVRTWLYYTLLRCFLLTKKIPWEQAWIMGYGVDEKGERMSKSKGNVIDPIPILEKYGADIFRFWNASESSLGFDFRSSEQRIQSAGKFITKLWNIARFISSFPQPKTAPKLTATDKWILAELSQLIAECMKGYKDFNFFIPATKIREFAWNIFAAHYIEMAKTRGYGQNKSFTKDDQLAAWFTLHCCLRTMILLLAPIIPFATEFIWQKLYGTESVHKQEFPKVEYKNPKLLKITPKLLDFNSRVWDEKKKKNLSLKDAIKMKIPNDLKQFEKDLVAMHNLQ